MKFKKDIQFAEIYGDRPINSFLANIFVRAYCLNKRMFRREIPKFKVFICDSEPEFRKHCRYYFFKWGTATVLRNGDLVTRSPEFVQKIGKWKRKDFADIMTHEMNHVFWTFLYRTCKPCWLLEGLACYAGNGFNFSRKKIKDIFEKYSVDHSILHYRYLERKFVRGHYPIYPVWAGFVRFIIQRYSVSKLIKLMDLYNKDQTRKNYDSAFNKMFGRSEKEMFREFVEWLR